MIAPGKGFFALKPSVLTDMQQFTDRIFNLGYSHLARLLDRFGGFVWLLRSGRSRMIKQYGEVCLIRGIGMICSLRRCFASGIGLVILLNGPGAWAQASEAGLRAAFLYNFFKFIEWPEPPGNELLLCALGAREPARASLAQIDNKPTRSQTIKVRFLDDTHNLDQQLSLCQLVYVPVTAAEVPLPEIIPPGTLLVVDEPDPEDARVGIALTRKKDRIEFSINELAVKQAGVKVSSQLLKLARNKPGGPS